jgi:hypothetical protein
MKNLAKKIMIYSMAGMMQLGLGATVGATAIEASAFDNGGSQIVQLDRQGDHDQRQREENRRHEREMHRHDGESDRDWNDRQWAENQRHDNTMNEIEAALAGFVLGSVVN